MRLSELVKPLIKYQLLGNEDPEIQAIQSDSRQVTKGTLFVAVPGFTVDGHDFAAAAVNAGAAALLVERELTELSVPQIIVEDTRHAGAVLADLLYGQPSQRLRAIGVTGTNGKTTVTHIIRHLLEHAGHRTGLLGTAGGRIGDQSFPMVNTTPEAVDVHGYLKRMVDQGCSHAVMEVSSHALIERRVAGVNYGIAVYTNLSQDHLDYHKTMDQYAQAKSLMFARLGNAFLDAANKPSYAVVNLDDNYASVMLQATSVQSLTYGLRAAADIFATDLVLRNDGVTMTVHTPRGQFQVKTGLIGRFNIYNVLAAVSVGFLEGISFEAMQQALLTYQGVPGRCERVDAGQDYAIFVDYAHTPDGLENVLSSVREFAEGRLLTVVGCGGDRDRTKRPIMAATALKHSDFVIFTSDNPRTEDPERILDDVEAGAKGARGKYKRITDRRQAIREAVKRAGSNDVIVIAGKGHEDYQILGRTKVHFDDREEARLAVQEIQK